MSERHPSKDTGTKAITRRELLRRAGIGAGALAVGRAFLGGAAWAAPSFAVADLLDAGDVLQIAVAKPTTAAQAAALVRFDDTHARPDGGVELLLWPGDRARLDELGIDYDITIEDLAAHDAALARASIHLAPADDVPGDVTDYRTLDQYNAEMVALAEAHPDKARLVKLPRKSLEDRDVFGIEIATDVATADGRPTTYIDGVHHAREWPAGEYPMIFAHVLLDRYDTDPRIKAVVDRGRTMIVPIVNVDGFHFSRSLKGSAQDNANLGGVAGGQGAYWRKNRRSTQQGQTPDSNNPAAYGVDPNRNYAWLWGATTGGALGISPALNDVPVYATTSPNPLDQTYYGLDAFSEPETANVADYMRAHNIVGVLSNHTSGRLVLRPWGHTTDASFDDDLMFEIGDYMAEAMGGYQNKIGLGLYATTGTTNDWAYGALSAIGYVLEHSTSFHPAYGSAQAPGVMWPQIVEAFTIMCEYGINPAHHSVIKGRVVDAAGAPVVAQLNLHKEFDTAYWEAGTSGLGAVVANKDSYREVYDTTITTNQDGSFEWHASPSTRPMPALAGEKEAFTFTVAANDQTVVQEVIVDRGQVLDLDEVRLG